MAEALQSIRDDTATADASAIAAVCLDALCIVLHWNDLDKDFC